MFLISFLKKGLSVINIKLYESFKAKEPIFQWKLTKENSNPNQKDIQRLISNYNSINTANEMFQEGNLKEKKWSNRRFY